MFHTRAFSLMRTWLCGQGTVHMSNPVRALGAGQARAGLALRCRFAHPLGFAEYVWHPPKSCDTCLAS